MLKQRLEQLRRLSAGKNADATKAMIYFLERIAGYGLFAAQQRIFNHTHPFSQWIIPVAQYYDPVAQVTSITLFWLKTYHFICGIAEFSNQLFAWLYFFEDAQTGAAAIFSHDSKLTHSCIQLTPMLNQQSLSSCRQILLI